MNKKYIGESLNDFLEKEGILEDVTDTAVNVNELIIRNDDTNRVLSLMEGVRDNYTFQIRDFVRFIRNNGFDVNIESIRAYFVRLNEENYTASTKRVKRQALKNRLKSMTIGAPVEDAMKIDRLLKQLDDDPATKAPKIQSHKIDRTRCLNGMEYKKLIQGARSDRQRRFVEFLYGTGARVSEMLGIKIRDIKSEGKMSRIRVMGKGKKERILIIPMVMLDRIRKTFQGGKYLFATSTGHPYNRSYVSNQIKKLGKHILHRNISAHTLRHSFATRMIQKTRKVQAVSQYLGHSSSSITLDMYVHEELSPGELFKKNKIK
jgi:site-specific recombinase XerD